MERHSNTFEVMIVAGESSGDLHGSNLIKAAAGRYPGLHFRGVGGKRMADAGCEILIPSDQLSVMGVVEVFNRLPTILKHFRHLSRLLRSTRPPDLLVLIDFPDFNLRLAKVAKAAGVPVLYYISPKVWAWRPGRARIIAERVDQLALIFPFEPSIYAPYQVPAEYVGNPLLDEYAARPVDGNLRCRLDLDDRTEVVGIFPGSRQSELDYIFDTLVQTAQRIHQQRPETVFVMPVAPSLKPHELEQRLAGIHLPIHPVQADIYEVAQACRAVLTVSGTVTLQLALTGTPMAIVYKVAPLSYAIGRRLIKIPFAGLPNIVAGREVVREFIQDAANPVALCDEMLELLDNQAYRRRMIDDLSLLCEQLGEAGCSDRVVDIIVRMLGCSPSESPATV